MDTGEGESVAEQVELEEFGYETAFRPQSPETPLDELVQNFGNLELYITHKNTDTDSSDGERAEESDQEDDSFLDEESADDEEEETSRSDAAAPERDAMAIYATLLDLSGSFPLFTADELPEVTEEMIEQFFVDEPSSSSSSEPPDDHVIARRRRRRERLYDRFRRLVIRNAKISGESVARVRKRDRIRAHLRRLAFSHSSGDEADTESTDMRRNRMITRVRRLLSQVTETPENKDTENVDGLPPVRSTQSISEIAEKFGNVLCVICLEKRRDTVLVPCGHLASCLECCNALYQCPVCRRPILSKVRVSSMVDDVDCSKCGGVKDGVNSFCGHLSFCHECDEKVANCLVCEEKIMQRVKMLWS